MALLASTLALLAAGSAVEMARKAGKSSAAAFVWFQFVRSRAWTTSERSSFSRSIPPTGRRSGPADYPLGSTTTVTSGVRPASILTATL